MQKRHVPSSTTTKRFKLHFLVRDSYLLTKVYNDMITIHS